MTSIAVIVGSLRAGSFSRGIARAAVDQAPDGLDAQFVEIADLAMFNEDLESEPPAAWTRFREQIAAVDGVLIVTPEYNRSLPACLKNAIDVGSRPDDESVWDGKPIGIISVTPHELGAFGANHAIRQSFVYLNAPVMQQPEAYVSDVEGLLDDKGELANGDTAEFLADFMTEFTHWVARFESSRSEQVDPG